MCFRPIKTVVCLTLNGFRQVRAIILGQIFYLLFGAHPPLQSESSDDAGLPYCPWAVLCSACRAAVALIKRTFCLFGGLDGWLLRPSGLSALLIFWAWAGYFFG